MELERERQGSGLTAAWPQVGVRSVSEGLRKVLRPYRELRMRTGCLTGLDFIWLEITRSCNLVCGHCYAGAGPELPVIEEMGLDDWREVLDEARALGCRRMQFIGGEPTLHPGLPALIEHARRIGFRLIEVFTNATHVRDDLLQVFKDFGVGTASSFYSADPETHDRITGRTGSFARTVDGLRRLLDAKIPLRVGIISIDGNGAAHRQTKRFLRRLGVHSIETDRVRGIGRGHRFVARTDPMSELCGHCWSGKLCVDSSGDAYPCVFARFAPVGNVLTGGLQAIVRGGELRVFRRQSYLAEHRGG